MGQSWAYVPSRAISQESLSGIRQEAFLIWLPKSSSVNVGFTKILYPCFLKAPHPLLQIEMPKPAENSKKHGEKASPKIHPTLNSQPSEPMNAPFTQLVRIKFF